MRVIQLTQFGGTDVLQLAPFSIPVPKDSEVLIEVAASGINRMDISQRQGNYPPPAGSSEILGVEVAGRIISAGKYVHLEQYGYKIGSEVCALLTGGGYATHCTAPIEQCLPKPKGLSMVEAASLPETYFTVWSNVFQRGGLQKGESLLIQGGSSGIGVTAITLAKHFGARVIVTAGSDEKCDACLSLGADQAINYRKSAFEEEVLKLTQGQGVDVILDMVAGDYIPREISCMAKDGRLVVIALLGGRIAQIDFSTIMQKRLIITGSTLRQRSVAFKAKIAQELREKVWPLLESKKLTPVIDQVFAPEAIAQAHEKMEASSHVGKLVIDWTL